jgi:dolichyl-phosphate-mannose-protein mannosyltransferase
VSYWKSIAIQSSLKRSTAVRNRLWNSAGFFGVVWFIHYFPFFLMSRQLFIHHYLPSHLASALIAGAVLHFLLSETIDYPVSIAGHFTRRRPSQWAELGTRGPIIVGGFFFALLFAYVYLAPLTYGTPGYVSFLYAVCYFCLSHLRTMIHRMDGEMVNSRRLLSSWTLHFAAKPHEMG